MYSAAAAAAAAAAEIARISLDARRHK